jgi:hypothetical protein
VCSWNRGDICRFRYSSEKKKNKKTRRGLLRLLHISQFSAPFTTETTTTQPVVRDRPSVASPPPVSGSCCNCPFFLVLLSLPNLSHRHFFFSLSFSRKVQRKRQRPTSPIDMICCPAHWLIGGGGLIEPSRRVLMKRSEI